MAESEAIQTVIMQVTTQATMVAVMALKEADTVLTSGASTAEQSEESTQEWMARLWIKEEECKHKENVRRLKEQFISGMNNETITAKKIKELMAWTDTSE